MFKLKRLAAVIVIILAAVILMPTRAEAADKNSVPGAVTISSGRLNVRSAPSAGAKVVTTLPKGGYITLLSSSGSWWRVEWAKGRYGYCHKDYVTQIAGTATAVDISSGSLNVRSGPGTGHGRKAALYDGETVMLLSSSGGWSRVLYHGVNTGYVSSGYLAKSGSYRAVSLSVPNYKQTDSRWASVKIGSSGKTMGKIGCATTGIAMMESYRTGTTIYPNEMAKKLSYTSTGNVYWPSGYTAVTTSEGYLQKLYNELSKGYPVLIGAKNKWGGQHWVVVTGYSGAGSLSASGFTINDPGSSSRVNLQAFFNAYPNFYKYFTIS